MTHRRAVFFDIDGTLWDRTSRIPPSTIEAIRKLRQNGHLAFLNSGRSRGYIHNPRLLEIGFDGIVSGCGCMIELGGQVLSSYSVPKDLALRTLKLLRSYGVHPILEGHRYLYLDPEYFQDLAYGKKLQGDLGERLLTIEEHWGDWDMCKFTCLADPGFDFRPCIDELAPDFTPMLHGPLLCEFAPRGYSKGEAIKSLRERLGLSREDTIAFGDSVNDLDMLKAAGIGVAMGNGQDALKACADLICPPLWEDGIYQGLARLGLIV